MIDADWLQGLRLELPGGYRIEGGQVGGSWVVLKVVYPDGKPWAIRIPKTLFLFGSYIHEVPNWLAPSPQYDVDRLNRKLTNLLGDPQLDCFVDTYNTFFNSLLEGLHEAGHSDLDQLTGEWGGVGGKDEATRILRFLMQTPAVSHRLEDWATRAEAQRRAWAEQAQRSLARIGPGDPGLRPETLHDNPLFVWGGAVMAGFFTKREFRGAVSAVLDIMESVQEDQARAFLDQTVALVCVLRDVVGTGSVSRFAAFCDATGFFSQELASEEERTAPDELCTILSAF
jgi:hypothetical protein